MHLRGILAEAIGDLAVGCVVVLVEGLLQRIGRYLDDFRELVERLGFLGVEPQIQQRRRALEPLRLARLALLARALPELGVEDHDGLTVVLLDHGLAHGGAVHELVDIPLALLVDDHAVRERFGWVDETPGRDSRHQVGLAAHAPTEKDPAAVVRRGSERHSIAVRRRDLLDHLAVVDESTRRQNHAVERANPLHLGVLGLDFVGLLPHFHGRPRVVLHDLDVALVEPTVKLRPEARFDLAVLDAEHVALAIHDEPRHARLVDDVHVRALRRLAKRLVEALARETTPFGPVPARSRLGRVLERRKALVAGVVEVVVVGRVAGLVRAERCLERHAVPLQPLEVCDALVAEVPERFVRDDALHLQ